MKVIKDKIVVFTHDGKINERSNTLLFQEIISMKEVAVERKLSGFFISLQRANCDVKLLKILVAQLNKIASNVNFPISIGDFTTQQYDFLKKETKETYIKIFKTFGLARLFLNTKNFKKQLKVLMFDDNEDEEELDAQASMLTKYEHNILYTKDMQEFKEKISDPNVDFAVSQTKINKTKEVNTQPAAHKFKLSKKLVTNLPVFIDTAVDHLETMTKMKAKKISHTISLFHQDIEQDSISSIMQFKGDIEGEFVLIFPKEIAVTAIEAMLGEKINENDTDAISDGIAEFCNIITGGAKTQFSKKDINVIFELPRTYNSLTATNNAVDHNNGIWINMELEQKPFYMYIVH